jgi:hypothetical protein
LNLYNEDTKQQISIFQGEKYGQCLNAPSFPNRRYPVMKTFTLTGSLLLIAVLLGAVVVPSDMVYAQNAPCTIRTVNGHYLTAVDGGGRNRQAIYTDATQANDLEHFALDVVGGIPVIKTVNGYYLTAVGGGGRNSDVIHTDATQAQAWERFDSEYLGEARDGTWYAFKTVNGHYLTAVGGGGHRGELQDTLHSDATKVDDWEKFKVFCQGSGGPPGCLVGKVLC